MNVLEDDFELILKTHVVLIFVIVFLNLLRKKQKNKNALVLIKSNTNEVTGCCHNFKDTIVKYFRNFDILSDEFFAEVSKLSNKYFPINYRISFFFDLLLNDASF